MVCSVWHNRLAAYHIYTCSVSHSRLTLSYHIHSRNGISYVALMMDKNDKLFAKKGRGRPTTEQSEQVVPERRTETGTKKLKKDMSMQNGEEILLSITIADDGMQRHVHMFPEVMFMDVIANTNRQKRDLFLVVVKDASGECFIGNATLLPCGQLWIFTKLYRYFFTSYMDRPLCHVYASP